MGEGAGEGYVPKMCVRSMVPVGALVSVPLNPFGLRVNQAGWVQLGPHAEMTAGKD